MKRKLPEAIQLRLAGDDCSVRERLTYNARTTDAVWRILADDAELRIKEKARENLASSNY